jgi:surfactin synthase thioesterase subunit
VRWSDDLPGVGLWAVQLPGRASRIAERPFTRMRPLVDAVVGAMTFERPFALFGHSFGALVAFEVTRTLRDLGREQPDHLFLSSCPAPPVSSTRAPIHQLSDELLLGEIERRWGPLPSEVLADPGLLSLTLDCYRADFEVLATYGYVRGEPLDCPITALVGAEERNPSRVKDWGTHTKGPSEFRILPGDHFYFRTRPHELLDIMRASLGD